MKVKLRDLTLEQYRNWNCGSVCSNCMFRDVVCMTYEKSCWVQHKDLYSDKFLDQELVIDEKLLDDKEKEYLEFVLKPFKNRIKHILKGESHNQEYITIALDRCDFITFPNFEKGKMYRGMKYKRYTPEELKLWKDLKD